MHTFVAVLQIEPTIRISFFDSQWPKRLLDKQPSEIWREKVNDDVLITVSPKELQRFLLTHLRIEGAFGKPSEPKAQERLTTKETATEWCFRDRIGADERWQIG